MERSAVARRLAPRERQRLDRRITYQHAPGIVRQPPWNLDSAEGSERPFDPTGADSATAAGVVLAWAAERPPHPLDERAGRRQRRNCPRGASAAAGDDRFQCRDRASRDRETPHRRRSRLVRRDDEG